MELEIIAKMRCDLPTKFGIPRQSGIVPELRGEVVFEKKYAVPASVRGIGGFSHLWLIWGFSENGKKEWSPTVRPPRLGGNTKMGVFATRSPFRPNPLGLSAVRLIGVRERDGELALEVAGADLMNGTPIYDIKPYLPLADCIPDAADGFAGEVAGDRLDVVFPESLMEMVPERARTALVKMLRGDPRPSYHDDPNREYGFPFAGVDVKFHVCGDTLTVHAVERIE